MSTTTTRINTTTILISLLVCAGALLASAYFLKGSALQYWIDSAIFVTAVVFIGWNSRRK